MRITSSCPCCGNALLRHARRNGVYWYCTSCHQEMMPLIQGQLPIRLDTVTLPQPRTLQTVKS